MQNTTLKVPSPTGMAGPSTEPGGGRRFGVGTASALVAGSVIGTGVFALPSALAVFGPVSLVAFVLVTIGAVALALAFRGLATRLPGAGGPNVYARDAFGEFAGFLIAWSYWITAWAGNAAIVVAWVVLTDVDAVKQDFGTPRERSLAMVDIAELEAMDFPAGSMAPKVEACMRFVTATGRSAAIGALRDAAAVYAGAAGTTITTSRSLA